MHTEPRAARLFLLASRSPRPVIVAVIRLKSLGVELTQGQLTGLICLLCSIYIFAGGYRSVSQGRYETAFFAVNRSEHPIRYWVFTLGYLLFGLLFLAFTASMLRGL